MAAVTPIWRGPLFRYWGSTRWFETDSGHAYFLTGQALEKRELQAGRAIWSIACTDRVLVGQSHGVVLTSRLQNRRVQVGYHQFSAFSAGDGRLLWTLHTEVRRPMWQGLELRQQVMVTESGPIAFLDRPRWLMTSEPADGHTSFQTWSEWYRAVTPNRVTWRMGRDVLVQERRLLHLLEWPALTPRWTAEGVAGSWMAGADGVGYHGLEPQRRCFTLNSEGQLVCQVDYESASISPASGRLAGPFDRWVEVPVHHAVYDVVMVAGRYLVADSRSGVALRFFGTVEGLIPVSLPDQPETYLVGSGADGVVLLQTTDGMQGSLYYIAVVGE